MRSVTLDTNTYIRGFEFGGKPMAVLQAGLDGEIDIASSQPIIDETLRVLRDKFCWSDAELQDAEAAIVAATRVVTPRDRRIFLRVSAAET